MIVSAEELSKLLEKVEQNNQIFDQEIMDLKLTILRLVEWIKEADQDRDFDPEWKELNAIMERLK